MKTSNINYQHHTVGSHIRGLHPIRISNIHRFVLTFKLLKPWLLRRTKKNYSSILFPAWPHNNRATEDCNKSDECKYNPSSSATSQSSVKRDYKKEFCKSEAKDTDEKEAKSLTMICLSTQPHPLILLNSDLNNITIYGGKQTHSFFACLISDQ